MTRRLKQSIHYVELSEAECLSPGQSNGDAGGQSVKQWREQVRVDTILRSTAFRLRNGMKARRFLRYGNSFHFINRSFAQ